MFAAKWFRKQGANSSEARDAVMGVVRGAFAPELLNRIDEIVLFNRLSQSDMDSIVNLQMHGMQGSEFS